MRILISLILAAILSACMQLPTENELGAHDLSELQKRSADYVSTNAREYILVGTTYADVPEGYDALVGDEQVAAFDRAIETRMNDVVRALRSHIETVVHSANGGRVGEKTKYFTYFRRSEAASSQGGTVVADQRIRFDFELELVGSFYLMSLVAPEDRARRTFTINLGGREGPVGESIEVEIHATETQDAFPKYGELFADGVFDIGIHFGGDYNEERFDITTAKWLVETLLEGPWENAGVKSFEDLTIDSAPFTRVVDVEGRAVEFKVYIYHSDMVTEDQEQRLSDVMKTSLAERDVVMYSGHAGDNAGFILDYQPRHEIKAREFADLQMASKYQIFVLDGCRTYRTYVRDIMANPNKTFDNVDIVTTVNTTPFSAGFQLIHEFLYWLTITNDSGAHFPLTWKSILRGVNTRSFKSVHYGVHGIGNNPQLNPHGSTAAACMSCTQDQDCGGGGNLCLGYGNGSACGVACASDTACGEGYRCARLTEDESLFYLPKQCLRRDYICQ